MKRSLLGVLISLFVFSFYELKAENVCRMESDTAFCSAKNYGKSVAVFGGSLSVFPESEAAKDLWRQQLGMKVTNYGVGGAGFSSLQGKSLQEQVREAGIHDVYILWASTNDYMNDRECGTWKDYTELDGSPLQGRDPANPDTIAKLTPKETGFSLFGFLSRNGGR